MTSIKDQIRLESFFRTPKSMRDDFMFEHDSFGTIVKEMFDIAELDDDMNAIDKAWKAILQSNKIPYSEEYFMAFSDHVNGYIIGNIDFFEDELIKYLARDDERYWSEDEIEAARMEAIFSPHQIKKMARIEWEHENQLESYLEN